MANPTHSGYRRLIWNFRERVVSDDYNRALQIVAAQHVDLLRRLHASTASASTGGGKTTPATATANPLRAIVLEGLRVRPEIGTTSLFIEGGCALAVFPDGTPHPDDSPARLISDPGVQTAATLVLTAGGGGTRIDVVECQPTSVVSEADSRDVFDPSTGLFAPVLVNKVARGGMSYRIRTGTAGAGWPGTASGWLPLAVCSVPSSASTWDDVTVWDVRPLLADLASPPHLAPQAFPSLRRQQGSVIDDGSNWLARGIVVGELGGWLVGGELCPSLTGATSLVLDATGPHQEPGFAAVASRPWYLYLAQPFGLPRWCRLSPASSLERTPLEPRGIPIFSQKAPAGLAGTPGSALALPTDTGLGNTTSSAIPVLTGVFGAGTTFCGSAVNSGGTRIVTPGISLAPTSGAASSSVLYNLSSTEVPPNATAVRVRFTTVITDVAGDYTITRIATMYDAPSGDVVVEERLAGTESVPAGGSFTDIFEVELPLPPNLPTGAATTYQARLAITWISGGAIAYSNQAMAIVGWRLG